MDTQYWNVQRSRPSSSILCKFSGVDGEVGSVRAIYVGQAGSAADSFFLRPDRQAPFSPTAASSRILRLGNNCWPVGT
jgi:hypothetical protein